MNRFVLCLFLVLSSIIVCVSCGKGIENPYCPCFEISEPEVKENFVGIDNISFENYPKVDGSTSARALNTMVACKLLNLRYGWVGGVSGFEWGVSFFWEDMPEENMDFEKFWDFWEEHIKTSQTHGAFMNLIDGVADIILTHRTISPDEKAHANAVGVTLIETSIALDAFVFIVNKNNPVRSLTVNQVQKIFTKKITNWFQTGGSKADIQVVTRPRNSGSEEVFRELVMGGLEPADFPDFVINPMWGVLDAIVNNTNSIAYTFYNYKELIARRPCDEVPVLAINDICPEEKAVKNGTYPFISEVRVAIRSNLDRNSMAYKLYDWLQSEDAKSTIAECGFIPK